MKNYYSEFVEKFIQETRDLDLTSLYVPFLNHVIPGGKILDAGCGSGRDTKYFLNKGYLVEAMDSCAEMAQLSSVFTGIEVKQKSFEEIDFQDCFDGIWANASLLHVRKDEMEKVYKKLFIALKREGILFVSYKYGDFEGMREGRYFSDYTISSFGKYISNLDLFSIKRIWKTNDQRITHHGQFWINVLLVKDL